MWKSILPLLAIVGLSSNVALAGDIKCPSEAAIATVGFNSVYLDRGFWNVSYEPVHMYDTNRYWHFTMSVPYNESKIYDMQTAVAAAQHAVSLMTLKFTSGKDGDISCVYYSDEDGFGGTAYSY